MALARDHKGPVRDRGRAGGAGHVRRADQWFPAGARRRRKALGGGGAYKGGSTGTAASTPAAGSPGEAQGPGQAPRALHLRLQRRDGHRSGRRAARPTGLEVPNGCGARRIRRHRMAARLGPALSTWACRWRNSRLATRFDLRRPALHRRGRRGVAPRRLRRPLGTAADPKGGCLSGCRRQASIVAAFLDELVRAVPATNSSIRSSSRPCPSSTADPWCRARPAPRRRPLVWPATGRTMVPSDVLDHPCAAKPSLWSVKALGGLPDRCRHWAGPPGPVIRGSSRRCWSSDRDGFKRQFEAIGSRRSPRCAGIAHHRLPGALRRRPRVRSPRPECG